MASNQKIRRIVLTGAVTVITIAGSLYGAGIKTGQQVTQQAQKTQEVTIDDRIDGLRSMRQNLVSKKELVEKQLRDLDVKIEERKLKNMDGPKREPPNYK
ncbi:uncharacterized protein AKAW2_61172S [Aspergillus luchuensis]|uniref:Uncharacterized protein n=3 Tax=Aspergillus subgen. Circumdati TaxID=2720871 RepID=A0A317VSH6_ASPEC|nr:uncharacterized protein BO83DRAFT_426132 [Aspergillus eucalypticola CBS 122712]XP_041546670.1 uncharacterized protein AKAW2_61172S [Aspergillus luchuensis]OJZ85319.1 hypothetical protein ASPFODRAFT_47875 [Aspergillus luchuensis CBS 106.47]GAA87695.1 similar to An12g08250 [Aspergillus luchuensis IFO 4308]PWY75862.1 hypothetical protein BO83DRAFT_426132 [Aspergillus eucalypticola CBS 122712]BCS02908.1 hypothetical protein AKAW2_61172S [Aspergillus luchuensis]BCS14559.1 hypothetical protein A